MSSSPVPLSCTSSRQLSRAEDPACSVHLLQARQHVHSRLCRGGQPARSHSHPCRTTAISALGSLRASSKTPGLARQHPAGAPPWGTAPHCRKRGAATSPPRCPSAVRSSASSTLAAPTHQPGALHSCPGPGTRPLPVKEDRLICRTCVQLALGLCWCSQLSHPSLHPVAVLALKNVVLVSCRTQLCDCRADTMDVVPQLGYPGSTLQMKEVKSGHIPVFCGPAGQVPNRGLYVLDSEHVACTCSTCIKFAGQANIEHNYMSLAQFESHSSEAPFMRWPSWLQTGPALQLGLGHKSCQCTLVTAASSRLLSVR